ncbi:septum formation protein Maf [Capsaspora owczarzaki ATCC 30864]|uniref:Septum formation protein Maf n=1 Tax=Capsaspora owczarzaki (strain ATCC 30864) TaxID=595528 RepID=A0A0D2WUV3_CAPO3|nr:septum formation protein Maf [Capsaspora owczarzaki ATCC 30864]KJE95818.1 septum formation protein Maf [Capsaspora owczarzaki ATCC 30864]|eukprot:XP_004344978.2 septum formation protein Maf [Capsaspora owczarzaki ATCC 30864]
MLSLLYLHQSMLLDLLTKLERFEFVLASSSPRRRDILNSIGIRVLIAPSTFAENLDKSVYAAGELWRYALDTAEQKALDVQAQRQRSAQGDRDKASRLQSEIIVSADTIVESNGLIMEKPAHAEAAFQMIKQLSGRTSQVHTGVVIIPPTATNCTPSVVKLHETTIVRFADLPDDLIRAYVQTGEPMDKAGGYGYQGLAGSLIAGIDGCYYNVVGFPLHSFCHTIRQMTPQLLANAPPPL